MVVYTALGDSITAGTGATSANLSYPSLVVSGLRRNKIDALGQVLAHPGWTSRALDEAVFDNPSSYLSSSTSISVWIGGDNLAYAGLAMLHGAARSTMTSAILEYGRDIGVLIGAIRKVSKANIILCTQYNPFPNSPLAAQAIAALNASSYAIARRMRVTVAPTDQWFEGRQAALIAGYRTGRMEDALQSRQTPIHPNDAGHAVIARGLMPLVRYPVTREL